MVLRSLMPFSHLKTLSIESSVSHDKNLVVILEHVVKINSLTVVSLSRLSRLPIDAKTTTYPALEMLAVDYFGVKEAIACPRLKDLTIGVAMDPANWSSVCLKGLTHLSVVGVPQSAKDFMRRHHRQPDTSKWQNGDTIVFGYCSQNHKRLN